MDDASPPPPPPPPVPSVPFPPVVGEPSLLSPPPPYPPPFELFGYTCPAPPPAKYLSVPSGPGVPYDGGIPLNPYPIPPREGPVVPG